MTIIREAFLSRNINRDRFIIIEFDEYSDREILPNDTIRIEYPKFIKHFKSGVFVLHYYILYENQNGNVYDTYYWKSYKPLSFAINIPLDTIRTLAEKMPILILPFPLNIIEPIDRKTKPSLHVYSQKDAEFIKTFFYGSFNN